MQRILVVYRKKTILCKLSATNGGGKFDPRVMIYKSLRMTSRRATYLSSENCNFREKTI
jgi:hypothetical protein